MQLKFIYTNIIIYTIKNMSYFKFLTFSADSPEFEYNS